MHHSGWWKRSSIMQKLQRNGDPVQLNLRGFEETSKELIENRHTCNGLSACHFKL